MSTMGRTFKGDKIECPGCHRWIGYWPDKMNPYLAHFPQHRTHEGLYGRPSGDWCEERQVQR